MSKVTELPRRQATSLLDPSFVYVPSGQTDVSVTILAEKRRLREIAKLRVLDDYTATDRDHHMMFIGGFRS